MSGAGFSPPVRSACPGLDVTATPPVRRGSLVAGVLWMSGLALLLFWLPLVGPFIAGYVGGRKAGDLWRAVAAALLPGLLLTLSISYFFTALSGVPLVGFLAGFGIMILIVGNIGPMLLGAILGGFTA